MANQRIDALKSKYDELWRLHRKNSAQTVDALKQIVQALVEDNDDIGAYELQKTVCTACTEVFGHDSVEATSADLYCRELRIRAAPVQDRPELCHAYWEYAKKEYGESSYLVRLLIPLCLVCFADAHATEELRLFCAEVTPLLQTAESFEERQLAALCGDFEIISGEKSGDLDRLTAAYERIKKQFGENALYALNLQNEIALLHRRQKDSHTALQLHKAVYERAVQTFGRFSATAIRFQKNVLIDYALCDKLQYALSEAQTMSALIAQSDEKNLCPDINECYSLIYMKMGRYALAATYAKAAAEQGRGVDASLAAEKANFLYAANAYHVDKNWRFSSLFSYMRVKEALLYNTYLIASSLGREKFFASENRGEYDVFSYLAIRCFQNGKLHEAEYYDLWDILCNYKTLLGDCELLHSAVRKKPEFSSELALLSAQAASPDAETQKKAHRRLLEISKQTNFAGYINAVPTTAVQQCLQQNEVLFDYYCVHCSDYRGYIVVRVTASVVEFLASDAADAIDELLHKLTKELANPQESDAAAIEQLLTCIADSLKTGKEADEATQYIICTDGELFRLPFELLLGSANVRYVTNVKDIARGRMQPDTPDKPIRDIHVFANPAFSDGKAEADDDSTRSNHAAARFGMLPGTLVEAEIIKKIFDTHVNTFLQGKASVSNFMENCNASILHIGTHAQAENGGSIYFSGANNDLQRGSVSSEIIAGLDMRNTRLAVLSACRTGSGEYKSYYGFYGLRRAFQLAGAKRIIAALWDVNDIAAAFFMFVFYQHYQKTDDAYLSLRYTKAYMQSVTVRELTETTYPWISEILLKTGNKEEYRKLRELIEFEAPDFKPFSQPFFWAGFILIDTFY